MLGAPTIQGTATLGITHSTGLGFCSASELEIAAIARPASASRQAKPMKHGSAELADLSWQEAEFLLTADTVVLLPLGAAAKEHGPHLKLDNDRRLADALKDRVMQETSVVVAPTLTYHHYPAFVSYPGSTSLRFETARDLVVDIVTSLAAFGPRRFYVLNTGLSTAAPLTAAAELVGANGILLHFTDIEAVTEDVARAIAEQQRGSHADEIETSMMLYLTPSRVEMDKAVRDDQPRRGPGGLCRTPQHSGIYSASGIWGDATLASVDKGRLLVETAVRGLVQDIERLRTQPLD